MRFNSFWLYTLLTIVLSGVCSKSFGDPLTAEAIEAIRTSCNNDSACIDRRLGLASGGSGGNAAADPNSCSALKANLTKEDGEFKAACSEVGRSGSSCDRAFYSCNECSGEDDDADVGGMCDAGGDSDDFDDPDGYTNSSSTSLDSYGLAGAGNYRVKKERNTALFAQFRSCPSIALNQIKDLKAELKELRDDEKELKDKVAEKQLDIQNVEADITSAQQTYQDKMAEKKAEFEAKQEELQGELTEKTKEINERLTSLQNELTGLLNSRDTLQAKYVEQVAAIENVCEAEAERELTKRREDYVKQLQNSNARQRNISSLLKLRLQGRNSDDEGFRRRAILRCQQNPARYQKPIQLLNNQYLINKRDLETAISQKTQAIQQAQLELQKADPENAEKIRKLTERYNEQAQLLLTTRNNTIGTCGSAPAAMGPTQTQNGASGCSGLMAKKNLEEQNLQRFSAELTEKQDDIAYTQQLFDAAQRATNGNTAGHTSAEDISTGGTGVVSVLSNLAQVCPANDPDRSVWERRYRDLTDRTLPSPPSPAALNPDPAATTGGQSNGQGGGQTGGGTTTTTPTTQSGGVAQ